MEEIKITNNVSFTTYWLTRKEPNSPLEEPQMRVAQYEIAKITTDYGSKLRVRIFSGISDLEKRKFYSEFLFPLASQFAKDLGEFLNEDKAN